MENKKLVFFGNGKLATGPENATPTILKALLDAGFEVEQNVTGPTSDLQPHKAKLAVLAAYGHVVSQKVIDEFPLGIINVHPSLLPQYRGSTPIEQAILDGGSKTGVSIMKLTAGMDEGPIYKQKTVNLKGQETKSELVQKLQEVGIQLLLEVLPGIASGKIKPRQQPHPGQATYTKRITKEDGRIDWEKPAAQIEREIRAYAGWPRSYTKLGDIDVILIQAHSAPTDFGEIGEIEIADEEYGIVMIQTGSGYLCISRLQPNGKKEMGMKEFLRGYKDRLKTHAT